MKKIISSILVILVLFSCSNESIEDSIDTTQESNQQLLSVDKVNNYIATELKKKGDLDWTKAPALVLWSAAIHSNGIITIGYGNKDVSFSENRSPELIDAKNNILEVIRSTEKTTKSNSVQYDDDILNFIEVKIDNIETII